MKKIILFVTTILSFEIVAISMNFTGNFRGESAYFNKLNLGQTGTGDSNKAFILGRFLVRPQLVIDDHLSIYSQWNLLTSPGLTPNATNQLGVGQGGYVFGDRSTSSLVLSRAWLEWVSDFGVFRFGRVPFSWGYGLIWDAGLGVWDDYQTTLDRLEYRLHFGHIIGAIAYSKPRKADVRGNTSDQDFYTIYLQYENPELEVSSGILYEKQVRSASQYTNLIDSDRESIGFAAGKVPYPLSNNVLDLYLKKSMGNFTLGGELGWLSGSAFDYNSNGTTDSLNALGLLLNVTMDYHKIKAFLDLMYASGDSNLNADHLNGFVLLHRNRRPGIILGHELLGPHYGNQVGRGSLVAYGSTDTFSGVIYLRPGFRVDWSPSWATGIEFLIAQKASVKSGEKKSLGVEIDFGASYMVYKNFELGANLAFLLPGEGLGVSGPHGPYGIKVTSGLTF